MGSKKEIMKKECYICLMYDNCKMLDILIRHRNVFRTTLLISKPSDFAKQCKLFAKDDVKELSLPDINKIELKLKEIEL